MGSANPQQVMARRRSVRKGPYELGRPRGKRKRHYQQHSKQPEKDTVKEPK